MSGFRKFIENKTSTPIQFLKYGLAGGLAAVTHILTFAVLNETVLPADMAQSADTRGWNFFASNTVAFLLANFVAYAANRAWVFQPGRHTRWKEVFYFYMIAAVAFVAGTPLGAFIVARTSTNEYFVFGLVLVMSVMVNFLGRKYWVFRH
ncbi:GtrA family protein [Pseudomonadota bacterium]